MRKWVAVLQIVQILNKNNNSARDQVPKTQRSARTAASSSSSTHGADVRYTPDDEWVNNQATYTGHVSVFDVGYGRPRHRIPTIDEIGGCRSQSRAKQM